MWLLFTLGLLHLLFGVLRILRTVMEWNERGHMTVRKVDLNLDFGVFNDSLGDFKNK